MKDRLSSSASIFPLLFPNEVQYTLQDLILIAETFVVPAYLTKQDSVEVVPAPKHCHINQLIEMRGPSLSYRLDSTKPKFQNPNLNGLVIGVGALGSCSDARSVAVLSHWRCNGGKLT